MTVTCIVAIASFTQNAHAQSCDQYGGNCWEDSPGGIGYYDPYDPWDDWGGWVDDDWGCQTLGCESEDDGGGGDGGSDPCGKSASTLNTKATCDDYIQPVNPLINCNTPDEDRIAEARRLFLLERDWATLNLTSLQLQVWHARNELYDVNYSDGTLEDFLVNDTYATNISINISGITTCG